MKEDEISIEINDIITFELPIVVKTTTFDSQLLHSMYYMEKFFSCTRIQNCCITLQFQDTSLVSNFKYYHKLNSLSLPFLFIETSEYIITNLEKQSKAYSINRLMEFLMKLPELKRKLQQMKTITNDLRVYASQLSDGM